MLNVVYCLFLFIIINIIIIIVIIIIDFFRKIEELNTFLFYCMHNVNNVSRVCSCVQLKILTL